MAYVRDRVPCGRVASLRNFVRQHRTEARTATRYYLRVASPILTSLFGTRDGLEFRRSYWGRTHVHRKLPLPAIRMFEQELLGFDVTALVQRVGVADVWFRSLEDAHRQVSSVSAKDALAFYDAGHTLYLHGAATPALAEWHRRLADELGHPADRLTFSLFAGKKTAGTRCHFDSLENFTIQLRGHKRWRLSPNKAVDAPLDNWVTGEAVPPELRAHLTRALPTRMSSKPIEVDLRAGELLYIPRGWWHETETADDSLAAFVAFRPASWADLITRALHYQLHRDPYWRRNVIVGGPTVQDREAARREMEERLASLTVQVRDLTVHAIAPELAPMLGSTSLRRNPLASLELEPGGDRVTAVVRVHRGILEYDTRLTASRAFAPLFEAISTLEKVSIPSLAKQFPRLARKDIATLVNGLTDAGFLTS